MYVFFTGCSQSSSGTEPNLKDLDTELKTVRKWFRFGIYLEVPEWKLLEIEENKRGVIDACRLQLFIAWGKRERRTWRKVVSALRAVGRTRLAEDLAEKYGKNIILIYYYASESCLFNFNS